MMTMTKISVVCHRYSAIVLSMMMTTTATAADICRHCQWFDRHQSCRHLTDAAMSVTHTHHRHHHHHHYCHDNGDYWQVLLLLTCHVGVAADIYTSHHRRHSDVASAAAADKDIDEDSGDLEQAADSVAVQQEWVADVTLVLAHNLYTVKQTRLCTTYITNVH